MSAAISTSAVQCDTPLDDLIQRLIQEAAQYQEKRKSVRQPVQAPIWLGVPVGSASRNACHCMSDPNSFRPLYRAWATDLSTDGIGLLCEHELPINVHMCVNLEALAGRTLIQPMRTLYCKQILPTTYRIGAVFSQSA